MKRRKRRFFEKYHIMNDENFQIRLDRIQINEMYMTMMCVCVCVVCWGWFFRKKKKIFFDFVANKRERGKEKEYRMNANVIYRTEVYWISIFWEWILRRRKLKMNNNDNLPLKVEKIKKSMYSIWLKIVKQSKLNMKVKKMFSRDIMYIHVCTFYML